MSTFVNRLMYSNTTLSTGNIRTPVTRTLRGDEKQFELAGKWRVIRVQVVEVLL